MIDFEDDVAAVLDDSGGVLETSRGGLTGRFAKEPIESLLPGGQTVERSDPVVYAQASRIDTLKLSTGDWIDVPGEQRYTVKTIPDADTAGIVRIELS